MRIASFALILLAGCDRPAEPLPSATATIATLDREQPRGAALGSTSSLRGQVSALTGDVSGFAVEVTDTATIVALAADTLFAFDQATLSPAAITNLSKAADVVRQGGPGAVTVTGHTDAKGSVGYNLALSRRRAQAVASWLQTQPGTADRRFEVVGKGSAEPVAPNVATDGSDDAAGRALNRRVVVLVPRR